MYSQFIDNVKTMAKDKLITVRISNEVYDQFKLWTESNNSNISKCLRDYIFDCLNLTQSSQNIDSDIDNNLYRQLEDKVKKLSSQVETLEDSLYSQLYNRLVSELSSQKIDNSIDNNLSSQNIDNSIDNIDTDKVTGYVDTVSCAIVDNIISSIQEVDNTAESTLSESPIMPLKEEIGVKLPDEELSPIIDDGQINDSDNAIHTHSVGTDNPESEVGSYKDAIDDVILPLRKKGISYSAIAKELNGKYISSMKPNGSTYWGGNLVKRAIDYREKGKV